MTNEDLQRFYDTFGNMSMPKMFLRKNTVGMPSVYGVMLPAGDDSAIIKLTNPLPDKYKYEMICTGTFNGVADKSLFATGFAGMSDMFIPGEAYPDGNTLLDVVAVKIDEISLRITDKTKVTGAVKVQITIWPLVEGIAEVQE